MKKLFLPALILSAPLSAEEEPATIECCRLIYPSCRFETHCGFGVFIMGEALWWVAKENGLIIAQEGAPQSGSQTADVPPISYNFRGDILRIDPDFDWGFRIGLGYNFCFDEWDSNATWTSFRTDKQTSFQSDGTAFAINLWGHSDLNSSSASSVVRANFDLKYDTLDLELGRAFGAGHRFCLRPYFGIRVAQIDQTLTDFNQVELKDKSGESLSTDLKALSDFTGAGCRFGLDGRFDFHSDISLYGLTSYSLLYGSFDASFISSVTGDNPNSGLDPVRDLVIADSKDCFHMGTSSLQLALGLQWSRGFCCDRYRFRINVSWEQNLWFQLNQMNHFQHQFKEGHLHQENGNLSLQGISSGVHFDF